MIEGYRNPRTPLAAQFSLSWGVARALVSGDLAPDAYAPDALADPLTRSLEAKAEIALDEELERSGRRGARLELDIPGEKFSAALDRVAGDPGLPLGREAVIAKFSRYAGPILGEAAVLCAAESFLRAPRKACWSDLLRELSSPR